MALRQLWIQDKLCFMSITKIDPVSGIYLFSDTEFQLQHSPKLLGFILDDNKILTNTFVLGLYMHYIQMIDNCTFDGRIKRFI